MPVRPILTAAATWAGAVVVLVAAALAALVAAAQRDVTNAAVFAAVGVVAFCGLQYAAIHATDRALDANRVWWAARRPDAVDAVAVAAGVLATPTERPGRHTVDGPTATVPAVVPLAALRLTIEQEQR